MKDISTSILKGIGNSDSFSIITALMMPMGFFNLQAVNIGLSVGDVGVVSIVVSAVSLVINPLIGNSRIIITFICGRVYLGPLCEMRLIYFTTSILNLYSYRILC